MKTEIVVVGSELLAPRAVDTNSGDLTERLLDLGIAVSFRTVVGDDARDLESAARTALRRARLVVACGGLGPTEDDRTREAFAAALGRRLVFRPDLLKRMEDRFRRRGYRRFPASNRKQADLIEGAEVLDNPLGTAVGQWIRTPRNLVALLPGPPRELRAMVDGPLRERLEPFATSTVVRRILKVTGMGESRMEDLLAPVYAALPPRVSLITLSKPGDLSVHVVWSGPRGEAASSGAADVDRVEAGIRKALGRALYSRDDETLERVIGRLLSESGRTLACAESCTGGLLGHLVTNVSGSSDYFLESLVTYSNEAKARLLGVPKAMIRRHGAVSRPVALAMARGARERSGADFGLGTTGIAGPTGGTPKKPVGLVFTSLAWKGGAVVERNVFPGGREMVKRQAARKAMDMLRRRLLRLAKSATTD